MSVTHDIQRAPEHIQDGMAALVAARSVRRLRQLQAHMAREMRLAAPFPSENQVLIDEAMVSVGPQRLTLIADLIEENLVRELPNWLAVTELGFYRSSEAGHAIRVMELEARGERQVPDRTRSLMPIYATIDDFSFGIRETANAERLGVGLDTDMVEQATRNCNESFEDQGWNGLGFNVDGQTAPGVLTSPVNTVQYTGTNKAWDHPSKTGAEILADLTLMIGKAKADRRYGPFNLYVPTDYYTVLTTKRWSDGVTTSDRTILDVLEGVRAGNRNIRIREADLLPANRTVLIQMTKDVIDVVRGQEPQHVTWLSGSGYRRFHMIVGCMIVRIKSDYNSGSGIVVGNTV